MAAGMHHGERKHDQSEDRQEVDRAERADHAQVVDEERASGNDHHQHDVNPADDTMGDRALRGRQLNGAKHECSHGGESVDLDDRRSNGRILARLIPDARLVTIDDGHLFLVTSAGQSAEIVSDFLGARGNDRRAGPVGERKAADFS